MFWRGGSRKLEGDLVNLPRVCRSQEREEEDSVATTKLAQTSKHK